ncbi:TraR/DksA C4-type zinc finger protein [Candidatus Kaiserbacteria bacterium]|nr:TraR/DksA C4-type zinc finger protein [Candidatus Kaiserbacteria bacterium]
MNIPHYKERLEAEKAKLEAGMGNVGRKNPRVPGDYEPVGSETGVEADTIDQALTITSFENNEGILRDLEARYDAVLAALARIEKGTYGLCSVCGGKIEKARLDADPAAATCTAHRG